MDNRNTPCFLVIDDDDINNHICTKTIELIFPKADIQSFTNPQSGLDYMRSKGKGETILFLDINMPVLSGWDVLNRFKDFPEEIKQLYTTYILSSSVAVEDRNKAEENPLVSGFIEKPLTVFQLKQLFRGKIQKP